MQVNMKLLLTAEKSIEHCAWSQVIIKFTARTRMTENTTRAKGQAFMTGGNRNYHKEYDRKRGDRAHGLAS